MKNIYAAIMLSELRIKMQRNHLYRSCDSYCAELSEKWWHRSHETFINFWRSFRRLPTRPRQTFSSCARGLRRAIDYYRIPFSIKQLITEGIQTKVKGCAGVPRMHHNSHLTPVLILYEYTYSLQGRKPSAICKARSLFLFRDDDDSILPQILPHDETLEFAFGFGSGTGHAETDFILYISMATSELTG